MFTAGNRRSCGSIIIKFTMSSSELITFGNNDQEEKLEKESTIGIRGSEDGGYPREDDGKAACEKEKKYALKKKPVAKMRSL